jgi:hypothetical protein
MFSERKPAFNIFESKMIILASTLFLAIYYIIGAWLFTPAMPKNDGKTTCQGVHLIENIWENRRCKEKMATESYVSRPAQNKDNS